MSDRCNTCHRAGTRGLKLTFYPASPNVGGFKVGLTIETDGKFCRDCSQRLDRMTRVGDFTEVVPPAARALVSTTFSIRGWGEPDWGATGLEWLEEGKEKLANAPLDRVV